ncbi:TlpA family protein disulfide reductase [Desulfoplanes formicivorans]|nr:TlpA disulfide reductase family protein [Desulfoplanes formicivorans]
MLTPVNKVLASVLVGLVVLTTILSGSAGASQVKTLSRQDLDAMISANKGAVTLVVYWATWCSSCRQEIPVLNEIRAAYPQDKVKIMGISMDRDAGQLEAFMDMVDFAYDIYRVPEDQSHGFRDIVALPTLVFYKKNGTKGWTHKGLMLPGQIRKTIDIFARETQ